MSYDELQNLTLRNNGNGKASIPVADPVVADNMSLEMASLLDALSIASRSISPPVEDAPSCGPSKTKACCARCAGYSGAPGGPAWQCYQFHAQFLSIRS